MWLGDSMPTADRIVLSGLAPRSLKLLPGRKGNGDCAVDAGHVEDRDQQEVSVRDEVPNVDEGR